MNAARCLVAMYHYVRDAEDTLFPAINAVSASAFQAQLDAFARECPAVDYPAFEACVRDRRPVDRACALLTFDDGFADHYETVFPALARRGWRGVFFLAGEALDDPARVLNVHKTHFLLARLGAEPFARAVREALARQAVGAGQGLGWRSEVYRYDQSADLETKHLLNYELPYEVADRLLDELFAEHLGDEHAFAGRLYLAPGQIREMARAGMTFGFHTERHRVLSRLDEAGQRAELASGVARIRALTGQPSVPFCFPYGHPHTYNAVTLRLLAEVGYGLGFNTVRRLADPVADPRFEVPRYDTRDLPPFAPAIPHA
jgi:peptidoglycan/xylan/chitin deacetylase (PgdA/CDA1 family)